MLPIRPGLLLWTTIVFDMIAKSTGISSGSSLCPSTCSTQRDVACTVRRLPYPCLLPDQNYVDHPNKPRNLTHMEHYVNKTRIIMLSWFLPKGYSYRAVRGFLMEVNTVHGNHQCYHFNLSTVNWTKVKGIQHVKFKHCLLFNSTRAKTVFINLYSLPKAIVGMEVLKLKLELQEQIKDMTWQPNISASPYHGNLTVTFSPWFKGATYIKGCLVEVQKGKVEDRCMKEIRFMNRNTHSLFSNVPCNKTYRVWIRPYQTHQVTDLKTPLDNWVRAQHTLVMPCYTPETTPETSTTRLSDENNVDTVAVAIVCAVLLCLLIVSLVILWFHRRAIFPSLENLFCCRAQSCQGQIQVTENNECNVKVFPIYYPESTAYEKAVITHIRLLHRKFGINIFSYDDQRSQMMPDMHEWVNENLKNNTVLIYYSKTVADFKRSDKIPEECGTFGRVCHYAIQRLNKMAMAGQAVVPIHVTFDRPDLYKEYGIDDIISLVRVENDKLYIDSFDTVVYKLVGDKLQNLSLLNDAETRDLRIYLSQLYDQEFLDDEDCNDIPEQEPMIVSESPQPFHQSDVYRQDMGSTDSCCGSELPLPSQYHHGDMFINTLHHHQPDLCKQMPCSLLHRPDKSLSSGYNSGSTAPFLNSGEYVRLDEGDLTNQGNNFGQWVEGHLPLDTPGRGYDPEHTYRHHVYCRHGHELDTGTRDTDSTYTLELDHIPSGHQPRMLKFIAPEIPASNTSLSHIQEEFLQVNQTSGF